MFQRILTLIVLLMAAIVPGAPIRQAASKPSGGYEGGTTFRITGGESVYQFNVRFEDSANPEQMTAIGRGLAANPDSPAIEVRGTYFVKTRRLKAFGEIRGKEDLFTITLDGTRANGADKFLINCKVKDVANGSEDQKVFYLLPGPEVAEGAHVEIALLPNKAVPGQVITGVAMVEVSNSVGPTQLSLSGQVAFTWSGGLQLRTSSPNVVRVNFPGNGKHRVDLASLGINFPAGAEDPRLVVKAKSSVELASQSIRLEYDPPTGSIDIQMLSLLGPPSITLGETYSLAINYMARNRTGVPIDATLIERAWISKKGEAKTEITPPKSWSYKLEGRATWRDKGPAVFETRPTSTGTYRLDYEISGEGVTTVNGFTEFEVLAKAGEVPLKKGDIRGTIKLDKSPIEIQEPSMLTLGYTLSGRPYAEVKEVVEMIGPSGSVVASTSRTRTIEDGTQATKKWIVNATEAGTYRIRTKVTSDDATPFESETSLMVKKKDAVNGGNATKPPPKAEGTYGLVKKVEGNLPDGVGPYGTFTGSIGEGFCNLLWTATRDYQGTFTWEATYSKPPSVLKPGEIIELTCAASSSRTHENQPYIGAGARWYVEGAETLEGISAFAGMASDGKMYPASKGKTKFKVGSGGKIVLMANESQVWGIGGNFNSCTYTYQWNAPPIEENSEASEKEVVNTRTGLTPLSPDDPEETNRLRAFFDKKVITLRAGEMGEIADLHISGFRTRTEDRVEVIFPDKTDSWSSLPGGIVVTGGNGSYWPPNMARPEHVDGYFFRARSNAPTSTQIVNVIVRQKKAGEVRLTLTVNIIGKGSSNPTSPPIPSGKTWTGVWSSNFDDLTLTQDGDKVIGKFGAQAFKIEGTVKGNEFTFRVLDGTNLVGKATLTMSEDGSTFKGSMVLEGDTEKLEWTGKRKN